jgi:hypothetical protein
MPPQGVQAMERELVLLLVTDLVMLLVIAATGLGPLLRALTARRVARQEQLLEDRMLALVQMPAPLPLEPLLPERMVQRQLSQETLQALREPKPRLVPLPEVLPPPTPMRSSLG